jgi:hypothetical protein
VEKGKLGNEQTKEKSAAKSENTEGGEKEKSIFVLLSNTTNWGFCWLALDNKGDDQWRGVFAAGGGASIFVPFCWQ